ncbi:MAG: Sec-independent protein translocase protein TatB [Rhodomicrobium sp.]
MFDIAWSELLLIAVVALIFIGPKELPAVLQSLGRMTAKLRRSADDFRRHFEESMRESGYGDLHKNLQDFRALNPGTQLRETLDRAIGQDYKSVPVPAREPIAVQVPLAETASGAQVNGVQEAGAGALAAPVFAAAAPLTGKLPDGAVPAEPVPLEAQKPVDEPSKDRAATAA